MKKFLLICLVLSVITIPFVSKASIQDDLSSILNRLFVLVGQVKQLAATAASVTASSTPVTVTSTSTPKANFSIRKVVESTPTSPNFLQIEVCNDGSKSLAEMGAGLTLQVSSGPGSSVNQTVSWSGSAGALAVLKRGACAYGSFRVTNSSLISAADESNEYLVYISPTGSTFVDPDLSDNYRTIVRSGGVYINRVVNKPLNGKDVFWVTVCNDDSKPFKEGFWGVPFYMAFTSGGEHDGFDMLRVGAGSVASSKGNLANVGRIKLEDLGYGISKAGSVLTTCNDYMYFPTSPAFKTAFANTKKMGVMMVPKAGYVEPTLFDNLYLYNQDTGEQGAVVSNKIGYDGLSASNKKLFYDAMGEFLTDSRLTENIADTMDDSFTFDYDGSVDMYWLIQIAKEYGAKGGWLGNVTEKCNDTVDSAIAIIDVGGKLTKILGAKPVTFQISVATDPNFANVPVPSSTKLAKGPTFLKDIIKPGGLVEKNIYDKDGNVIKVLTCKPGSIVQTCSYRGVALSGAATGDLEPLSANDAAVLQSSIDKLGAKYKVELTSPAGKKGLLSGVELSCAALRDSGGRLVPGVFGDPDVFNSQLTNDAVKLDENRNTTGTYWLTTTLAMPKDLK